MSRFHLISWLLYACIFLSLSAIQAQQIGLSAVTEMDQSFSGSSYYYSGKDVKNWVHSGRPGLFMSKDFNQTENSTFHIQTSGVYYISVNLLTEIEQYGSYHSIGSLTMSARVRLTSNQDYVPYNKQMFNYGTVTEGKVKNLRISAYIQLEAGWNVTVRLGFGYSSNYWTRTIKAGSTLSIMYVSKSSMFPGVLLSNDYEYLYLKSPSYSRNVIDWNEIDEGSAFPESQGNVRIPHNGLYHVIVNLVVRRYSSLVLKFSVMINNQTEAISKTTQIDSEGSNTVTLEGILNLSQNQIISITISNPALHSTWIRVYSSSRFFIFSKGTLSQSAPVISTHYKSGSKKLPANTFSKLTEWNTASTQSLDHYSNVKLQQGEFLAPKTGYYQIYIAVYLRNCTSTAVARLSIKTGKSYKSIGPDTSFTKGSKECYFKNSLVLQLNTNDQLRVEVKSDTEYIILPQTLYQVIFQTTHNLWPAAIFQLQQSLQFQTNSAAIKVHDWLHHNEGDWNDMFFNASTDKIQIKSPGLYLFSYNLVVKAVAGGEFHSQIVVSGATSGDGGSCMRGNVPQIFTCTTSTLLNLMEDDKVTVQVWMKDKSKQSVQVLTSSRMTVTLLGNTRSHPVFKLNVQPPPSAYTTKAGLKDIKTLTDFTFPNTSFFQSGAVFSNLAKTFNSGKDLGFFLLNNLQFNLKNDGYLTSLIGSMANQAMVYSKNHKASHFSLPASDLTFDSQFYFNVSAQAPTKTALKWQPESGSVVSGVYVDKKKTTICFKAQLKANTKLQCSSEWTQIPISHWTLTLNNNIAKVTKTGIQITKSGFYLTSLNLAMKANTSNTVINVKISSSQGFNLNASETSPTDGEFSIFLQAVLEATSGQDVDIQVKCKVPTEITYATGGGLFAFKVDETRISPGMRRRFRGNYRTANGIRSFYPSYYYGSKDFEQFRQDIHNKDWKLSLQRSGLYLITVVGYIRQYRYYHYYYQNNKNFELGFSSPASMNASGDVCSLDSSSLYFKNSETDDDESIALTGFISWDKNNIAAFLGRYNYYSSNHLYMSIQFVGDIDTSSGFSATLQKDISLAKGQNQQLAKKSWTSDKTCGQYTTKDAPTDFDKFTVSYTGYFVVAMNLVLDHGDRCDFTFCFTVDNKLINPAVSNIGCFKQHLRSKNHTSTSTVSNSELLYLKAGQVLSVQLSTNTELTISKKSSFSMFYLGTAGAILGFSSIIKTAIKRPLPSYRSGYYHYYHYYNYDDDYAQYVVAGWNTNMGFQNGIKSSVNDTFICPQDGVYMVMAKLHVKAQFQVNETCNVKLQLAVDGEVLDFSIKRDVVVSGNTLSFTTTLRLEKWQGVTVRLSSIRTGCGSVDVETGSSFAVVYLDGGKKEFTLWPNIGPHIIEFPEERAVYVREDLVGFRMVTCKAVGKYPITYQWKTYSNEEVVSESSVLDTRVLNDTSTDVQCVATMRGLVAESSYVTINSIDPTIIFSDAYDNRTYDLPERNETTSYGYRDVLVFGAREKKTGYYYWYWYRRVECRITKGNVNSTFSIRYLSSYYRRDQYFKLRARSLQLDREAISEYKIEITCNNREYKDATNATTTIHVKILDANDNLPVFEKEIYHAQIPKTIQGGEDIIQVIATDDDVDENAKITYSLIYSSDSYIFTIDRQSGVISLKGSEQLSRPYYRFTAVATDQGTPRRSGYATVVLDIPDYPPPNVTNNNPVFIQRQYKAYLLWGTPKGTVVTTVHAHDPVTFDHQNIRYYVFRDEDSVFEVDSKTGIIKTKGEIKKLEYRVEIAAEYEYKPGLRPGQFYNTTLVIVLVRKVDIRQPHFEKSHYTATVSENANINTKILTVTAFYKEALEYSIPTPRGKFKIDKNSGEITLIGKLDYEKEHYHSFVVSATDPKDDQKSTCTDVTITVSDYNDNPPVITYYPRTIRLKPNIEGRQEIGHIIANDKDNGTNGEIKYYLDSSDYNGVFSLDRDNGKLYVNGGLLKSLKCCDVPHNHSTCKCVLRVTVKDQGYPSLESQVEIVVIPYDPNQPTPNVHHHKGHHSSNNEKTYIIAGIVGGVVVVIILIGALYWRRRRRQRAYVPMNYIGLPSDEEDEELLDPSSDHDDNDNEGRLSLISAASDENLLRNEEPC